MVWGLCLWRYTRNRASGPRSRGAGASVEAAERFRVLEGVVGLHGPRRGYGLRDGLVHSTCATRWLVISPYAVGWLVISPYAVARQLATAGGAVVRGVVEQPKLLRAEMVARGVGPQLAALAAHLARARVKAGARVRARDCARARARVRARVMVRALAAGHVFGRGALRRGRCPEVSRSGALSPDQWVGS